MRGAGPTFDRPLPLGTPDAPWIEAVTAAAARVRGFEPGALVVSLGFDAAVDDPSAAFAITEHGFAEAARRLAALNLPTLLVGEGGYLGPSLARYLRAFEEGTPATR